MAGTNPIAARPLCPFQPGDSTFQRRGHFRSRRSVQKCLATAPAFIQPRFNLGLAYERLGQFDAAITEWQWVVQNADPDKPADLGIIVTAHNNLGRLQETLKRLGDALDNLQKSLELNPQQPDAIHHWVFLREKTCSWPIYESVSRVSLEEMKESTRTRHAEPLG